MYTFDFLKLSVEFHRICRYSNLSKFYNLKKFQISEHICFAVWYAYVIFYDIMHSKHGLQKYVQCM